MLIQLGKSVISMFVMAEVVCLHQGKVEVSHLDDLAIVIYYLHVRLLLGVGF